MQIPSDLCAKAISKLTQFSLVQVPDITPGSVPIQERLTMEAHCLSLLWALMQQLVDDLTAEHGFSLHPFLRDKSQGQFLELPEHLTRTPTPSDRPAAYQTAVSSIYTAAITHKAKDLLDA